MNAHTLTTLAEPLEPIVLEIAAVQTQLPPALFDAHAHVWRTVDMALARGLQPET